ncbi:fructose-6-phosphate aldolase [Oleidesulfovibrio sp.]|uniref:fructose-6-phosphate aldolase n=1 Tax=Oleidesulfovibrio sp. TaxID=2909707 RepID=UPI003A88ADFD
MEFFLDTANLDEIRLAKSQGLIDGVTTNPTLLSKQGGDWQKLMQQICDEVDGPVSLEVVGLTTEKMLSEAKELIAYGDNVVIKLPMTADGLAATRALSQQGIKTNVTLVFSALQALLAAKAGATYVSPFLGRLDGIGHEGMEIVGQIRTIFDNYDFQTKILAASIRNPMHVLDSALVGADVATVPYSVLKQLMKHPLTDSGLEQFLADWKKLTE